MDLFDRIKNLEFPPGEYVVVGGAMEAHGIRKAHDIDIVVTPKLYNSLKNSGWTPCDCDNCLNTGRILLKGDGVDILPDYSWEEKYKADTQDLIQNADIINEIPFVKLEELKKWKEAAGRDKDKKDIILIDKYLNQTSND